LLKFRRLLEREGLTGKLFEAIKANLAGQGLMLREGTVVDDADCRIAVHEKPGQKTRSGNAPGSQPASRRRNRRYVPALGCVSQRLS